MNTREFRWIKGFENRYDISSVGNVGFYFGNDRNFTGDRKGFLKSDIIRGHLLVTLKNNGIVSRRYVHHLVYETFVGSIPIGMFVHHKDENPNNNLVDNLVLCTRGEHNRIHKMIISEEDRRFIKFLICRKYEGLTQEMIASDYNVCKQTITNIKKELQKEFPCQFQIQ